jgi:hypothetical protein
MQRILVRIYILKYELRTFVSSCLLIGGNSLIHKIIEKK